MKLALPFIFLLFVISCDTQKPTSPLLGTWKLTTATVIERGDTTVTDYTKDKEFIKMFNETHFSFTGHDLTKGKDSATAFFTAGTGTYTLKDSNYVENLQYCTARDWENNKFDLNLFVNGDTLIQRGIEKVAGTNVDRFNIEKYVRVK